MANKNPDIHRQQAREYYHRHRERLLEQKRKASPEKKKIEADRKRANYLKHKDKIAARDLLPSRRLSTAKSMAKKRGFIWNITIEDYTEIIKNPCFYCANRLDSPVRKGSGLDRLDSDKGYEMGNVVSCCYFCNGLKSDKLTPEETKAVVKALIEHREKEHAKRTTN